MHEVPNQAELQQALHESQDGLPSGRKEGVLTGTGYSSAGAALELDVGGGDGDWLLSHGSQSDTLALYAHFCTEVLHVTT